MKYFINKIGDKYYAQTVIELAVSNDRIPISRLILKILREKTQSEVAFINAAGGIDITNLVAGGSSGAIDSSAAFTSGEPAECFSYAFFI